MEFIANSKDWIKYADAIGDYQMIHRDLSKVDPVILKKHNIIEEFAPGMYEACFIQGRPRIQSVRSIRFEPTRVYDGDVVKVVALPSAVGRGVSYEFSKGDDIVCRVNGVKFGDPDGKEVKIMGNVCYEHLTDIDPTKISRFLDSLGCSMENARPSMFLASKFAPALLAYGESKGVTDAVHATQSSNFHFQYEDGPMRILIGDEKISKRDDGELKRYKVQAIQNDRVVASGRSSVGILEKEVA